jgi:hypothetical protein
LSAENEITFRNIDVSQFQEVIAVVNIEKRRSVLEANTVGSMVRFVHFIVDIIAFSSVRVGTLFQFVFSIEGNEYILLFLVLMVFSFVLYFSVMEFKFQKLGKFITKTKVNLKGRKPSINDIMRRTFCRLIPFDRLSFLFMENGIHDGLSNTRVIKSRTLTNDFIKKKP